MAQLKENIVALRKANHMSQGDVAQKLFVTPQAVSRWERGETEPDIDTIKRMSKIFGVSVEQVITGRNIGLSPKTEKTIHYFYLASSTFMALFSLFLVSALLWRSRPTWLFTTYLIVAIVYLVSVLSIEIAKEIYVDKLKKEDKGDEE